LIIRRFVVVKYWTDGSEEHELFSDVSDNFVRSDFKDVEADCLAKWSALSNKDDITFFD